jgi:hypothetical protein
MTKFINLLGQPGTGKSTTMADLFCTLKYQGLEVEMCPEWIKKWAWEGRTVTKYDQVYIMSKEMAQQSRLFNKVDYAISDSPIYLSAFYQHYYYKDDYLTSVVENFYKMAKSDGVEFFNFFLKRNKPYNPKGRYQTEEESDAIANAMEKWFLSNNIGNLIVVEEQDKERAETIIKYVNCLKIKD